MATAQQASAYSASQSQVLTLVAAEVDAVGPRLSGLPIVSARNLLIEWARDLLASYGPISSTVAADYYDGLRIASGPSGRSFTATPSSPDLADAVEGSMRWAVGSIEPADGEPDPGLVTDRVKSAMGRHVQEYGRRTILDNVGRDPARPLWASVPTGAETCRYCVMLASRGAVYHTKTNLRVSYHDHCDCQPVAVWPGDGLPYDRKEMQRLYAAGEGIATD